MSTTYKNLVKTFIESYYHDKELALLKEAIDVYFACKDSIPAIDKNGMLDFDKLKNKNRLINSSEVYGYQLFLDKENADSSLLNFHANESTYFYVNKFGLNKVLSSNELLFIEALKQYMKTGSSLEDAKLKLKDFVNKEIDKNEKEKLRKLKVNIQYSNAIKDYKFIDKKEDAYSRLFLATQTKLKELDFVTSKDFSFSNIRNSKSTVFKATITDNYRYLVLDKTFEQQNNFIQNTLKDYAKTNNSQKETYDFLNDKYIKSHKLNFEHKTGLEIYKDIEIMQSTITNKTQQATSLSLLSHKINGVFNESERYYVVFDSRLVSNIQIA